MHYWIHLCINCHLVLFYNRVMSQLERIWECELESFNAVEKLAQCLDQRGRTWQRLKHLQKQVHLVFTFVILLCFNIFFI